VGTGVGVDTGSLPTGTGVGAPGLPGVPTGTGSTGVPPVVSLGTGATGPADATGLVPGVWGITPSVAATAGVGDTVLYGSVSICAPEPGSASPQALTDAATRTKTAGGSNVELFIVFPRRLITSRVPEQ
jgi:hypothetical protein